MYFGSVSRLVMCVREYGTIVSTSFIDMHRFSLIDSSQREAIDGSRVETNYPVAVRWQSHASRS
jgi:hypothetical protein